MKFSAPLGIAFASLPLIDALAIQPRASTCYFGLTARGPPNGTILETSMGENRVGGTYPPSNYTISNHVLTTDSNQTCLVQPSTSQFECIAGAESVTNFTLADNGNLLHDGCEEWWACQVDGPKGDGSWDIYGEGLVNKTGCEQITLLTGGFSCGALGSPTSSAVPSATSTTTIPSATSTTSITCPTSLLTASSFLSPEYIKTISSAAPDTSFPSTNGSVAISTVNSTLLNFFVPGTAPYDSSLSNTCALIFLFPYASELANSSAPFYFSGTEAEVGRNGGIDFTLLSEVADETTTFNSINSTQTSVLFDYGKVQVFPGNAYEVARFRCAGDRTFTIRLESVGEVELDYVQDEEELPIGAFVVPCV
ncbi:hypothetical protein PVAG01_03325 [Phlyctema vagabunda]|uniref:Ubiquitin 3 binding protein But2 C-terminal domain-containing protein n=1 Tax=Phlyctema vagabunda TaxID=108571 RepID=A0ABR4PL40_9HELO